MTDIILILVWFQLPPVPVNVPFTIHEQDKALIRDNIVTATVQVRYKADTLLDKLIMARVGGLHSTKVAYLLLTQQPWV